MAVAKWQRREKPAKIEQNKVRGPEWGPQVKQTTLLAGPGTEKHIKRGAKASSLSLSRALGRSSLRVFRSVTRVYVPWFFVSSQQRFRATDIKALGASQLSGLGQTMLQLLGKSVLQLHFIYKIAGESKTWREESGGVRGEGGGWGRERKRERERERVRTRACTRESPRESALAPPFICFFLHLGLPYAN